MDFATDLPSAERCMIILVLVDVVSKACKRLPLVRLPSTFQNAELLFQYIFQKFSIPEEIVSDRVL